MSPSDAMLENMRVMNVIVSQMKEIPILPSEIPQQNDTNPLNRVEFPDAGGILTFMDGHEEPYKGFPYFEFVDKIDVMKKLTRAHLSGLYHALKTRNKLQLATLLVVPWFFKDFLRVQLYTLWKLIDRFRIKKERYCDAIREMHRVFSLGGESEELKLQIKDVFCMFLEFDNAYRYRFQDVIVELNKEKLRTAPRKELIRLFDVLASRENSQEIKDTWKLARLALKFYLPLDRELTRILQEVFLEADLEKLRLTKEDVHYCHKRKDYTFGFQLNQEPKDNEPPVANLESLPVST